MSRVTCTCESTSVSSVWQANGLQLREGGIITLVCKDEAQPKPAMFPRDARFARRSQNGWDTSVLCFAGFGASRLHASMQVNKLQRVELD
mmetsp:Transcript_42778/g.106500  ORF Transcript_42778/g.106500 Transcript_42778/m.106500 type:complete len:90 (+) Transcript_42778:91-360(+)